MTPRDDDEIADRLYGARNDRVSRMMTTAAWLGGAAIGALLAVWMFFLLVMPA